MNATARVSFGKYRTLSLAIALFILLQGGLFIIDRILSRQIQVDAIHERLASRQFVVHLQLIGDSLLILSSEVLPAEQRAERLKLIARSAQTFGRTLEVFLHGGTTVGKRDSEVEVEALTDARALQILEAARRQWAPVAAAIQTLVATDATANDARARQEILAALPALRKQMVELAALMDDIAAVRAERLQWAKIATLGLAALNFLVLIYYLFAHLRRNDLALERARKETDDILNTTQEGLFLLNPDYTMGSQHSRALEKIFGRQSFAGVDFFALLAPMVSDKTLATAREYLDLLFKHDVKEKLVTDLNPLNCVQTLVAPASGKPETRFLEFGFNRVREQGTITHLLVTVNDITQRVNLERSLKETEARARDQLAMLIEILQIEAPALEQFLRTAREGLQAMNRLLQAQETGLEARGSKVHALFRHSHRIKGDAAALGLQSLTATLEKLESTLTAMHESHQLAGEDFLPVAVQVKTLYEQIDALETLLNQISQARSIITIEPARPPQSVTGQQSSVVERWRRFAEDIAHRQHKRVELSYAGPDPSQLPVALQDTVNTLINQFIRNAIVHGIESPEERQRLGKPASGQLSIHLTLREDGGLELGFRDDGRGISLDEVRQAAIARGLLSPEAAAALDARRLLALIFKPGMSTRATADGDAGRGAGLDAVRELVAQHHGSIRLGTTPNEYCHFRVTLAPPAPLTTTAL